MGSNTLAFLVARLAIGMSFFGHGAIRLPKLQQFSDGMVKEFADSPLPSILVLPFSYALPFLELVVGVLLIIGLFTKYAALATGLILVSLIFGSGMIENWGAVATQLTHTAFIVYLLSFVDTANRFSVDHYLANKA